MSSTELAQPEEIDALIVTLNRMGYMLSQPEKYIQAFIDFSAHASGPVLDIGAAYGLATIPALKKGAYVIANDLDERHLKILQSKVPQAYLRHLVLIPGRVPTHIDFAENSLGAVLAARVLNFIMPEELEIALEKIFNWLMPGGKFFFLAGSPYMGNFRKFLPTYLKHKAEGHSWPGFIDDMPFCVPERACDLPHFINLLDEETLIREVTKAGFVVEETGYSPAIEEHPQDMKLDGREQAGIIAHKPLVFNNRGGR